MLKIIGECGVNFRNMEEAKQMISECKMIGLWASKFQVYNDDLIKDNPNRDFLKSIMLGYNECKELIDYGKKIGQIIFFTPMYEFCVEWLDEGLNVPMFKIRFKDANPIEGGNFPNILEKCVKTGKPTFMSSFNSRKDTFNHLPFNLYPIFCVPVYPASIEDYENIDFRIFRGISDHISTTDLLKRWYNIFNQEDDIFVDMYYEKHVKLDGMKPLEDAWSVSFSELEEVLNT